MNITPLSVDTLSLTPIGTDAALYPANDLFPADDLFPEFGTTVLDLSENTLMLTPIVPD